MGTLFPGPFDDQSTFFKKVVHRRSQRPEAERLPVVQACNPLPPGPDSASRIPPPIDGREIRPLLPEEVQAVRQQLVQLEADFVALNLGSPVASAPARDRVQLRASYSSRREVVPVLVELEVAVPRLTPAMR